MPRKTGIDIVGDVPPAAHLCQFYQTKQDIADILVPYFKAGLENNELCLWVTAEPFDSADAFETLKLALPDFQRYLASGQMQIVPYTECYSGDTSAGPRGVFEILTNAATAKGFKGIRVADQAAWLAEENRSLAAGQPELGHDSCPVMTLCVYPLSGCGTAEVVDAIRSHQITLIKQNGHWQAFGLRDDRAIDRPGNGAQPNAVYRDLFNNTLEAMEIIDAESGRILLANPAAARIFGFGSPEEMTGVDPLEYIPSGDRDRVAHMMAEYMFEKDLHQVMDVRVLTRDGRQVWVSAIGVRTEYEGRPAGLVSMRDVTAQKDAERAFQESQEQLMAIFDGVRDGIVLFDLEGKVVLVNKRIVEVSGYTEQELVDTHFDSLPMVSRSAVPDMKAAEAKILSGEGETSFEVEVAIKSGEKVCLEVRVNPLKYGDSLVGAIAVLRDITARRKAEEMVRMSERQYRLLADHVLDVIWTMDLDLKFTYVSPSVTHLLGHTLEEVLYSSLDKFVAPDSLKVILGSIERGLASHKAGETSEPLEKVMNMAVVRKDGSPVWTETRATLIFDAKGSPTGILGVTRDITERRKAEESLRQSEEKHRLFVENAHEAIVVLQDGNIVFANSKLEEMSGYRVEELISRPMLDFVHSDDRRAVGENYQRRIRGEEAPSSYPIRLIDKSGETKWAEVNAVLFDWEAKPAVLAFLADITQRKNMEDALRENEKRYRLLAENVSDVIWVADLQLKLKYISPSITKLVGYSNDEVMLRSIEESMTPSSVETVMQRLKTLRSAGGGTEAPDEAGAPAHLELKRKDGSTVWVETTYSFIHGSDGQPTELMGVIRDITERKQAEEALRNSEEKYRSLVENAGDVVCSLDAQGCFTYVSPSIEQLTHYAVGDIVGQPLSRFVHADDAETLQQVCERVMKGKSEKAEFRWLDKDGPIRYMRSSHNVVSKDGEAIATAIVMRDVTDHKQAEEALRESERRYRLLAENVSDVIWVVDLEFQPTFFTPSVSRLLGYTVEEAMSKPVEEVLLPQSLETARERLALSLASQSRDDCQVETLELQMKRKDGAIIWVESKQSLVWDENGQAIEVMGVMRDITQRKQAEELFEALSVSSPIGVYILSDKKFEFVNPQLRSYLGYTDEELLGKESLGLVSEEDRGKVRESAVRMLKGERTSPYEYRIVTKSGEARWVMETVTSIEYRGKRSTLGNLMDVTQRKEAEQALRDSEERFRHLIETTSDLVWEVDENGRYTYVSPRIEHILGYRPDEVVGKTPFDLMPFKEANRVAKTFAQAITSRQPIKFLENINLHKSGSSVVLESNGVPFLDGNGDIRGYRGIGRDITERKRAEEQLQVSFQKLEKTLDGVIMAITSMVETRDRYTAGHQKRVTRLACAIAEEMGLSEDQTQMIRMAGLLHDLGKLFIPTEILCKPGQLTDIETAIIKTHPQAGYDILKNIEFPWPIAQIVAQHHERLDGSGYPLGLSGGEIHLEARILAVSDVVEAMSSHRPYRPALGLDKALKEIVNNKATLYDPDVVEACVRLFVDKKFRLDDETIR